MSGPLTGIRIIELAGIGPGPFCGMMLADMGAEVITIARPNGTPGTAGGHDILNRSRKNIAVNLKDPAGVETVLRLCESADALFEGFRPGVTERLGLGPEACLARNPKLVYGRMTGWGQDGPLSQAAGHDINYIALSGALHAIGRRGEGPVPPLNLVGDFGGGGMMLAYALVCALLEASRSGQGQVIDCSMHEGAAALMAMFYGMKSNGLFSDERGTHLLDSGAFYYDTYRTADDKYIAIGPLEPQFYAIFKDKLDLDDAIFADQMDTQRWPQQKAALAKIIAGKTRDQWCELLEGTDACFAPVLGLGETATHPHNRARQSFIEVDGVVQHAPTPRFSRSGTRQPSRARAPGADTESVLRDAGFAESDIASLLSTGAVVQRS